MSGFYELLYLRRGRVAHCVLRNGTYPDAVCGVGPQWPSDWYGTGTQAEYERAERLPRCQRCQAKTGGAR